MKSQWKIHLGVRYFHFDLSGYGTDDAAIMAECDAADAVIMAEPENSVLILNDVRDSTGSMELIKYLQVSAERSSPFIARAAVVGISGAKSFILQAVNRFSKHPIVPFEDVEQAKDWLVQGRAFA